MNILFTICGRAGSKGFKNKNLKYNIDAVQCCLNAGLQNFLEKPFIALNYEEVSAAFPAYYL